MGRRYLIAGAGFSGAVLANRLVVNSDCSVDIWEEKNHLAGNCHTARDKDTGVMVHEYGPHIFNTDKKEIWDFVNSFIEIRPFINRMKANYNGHIYSMPVNLHTINQFFNTCMSPKEARAFITEKTAKDIEDPKNFEEQALKFIGHELYKAFFYGYTKKQWGCEPAELPASILKRIPLRFNYDDNYYNNPYQGIPINGYTEFVEKLIDHPSIQVTLQRKFVAGSPETLQYDHVFFTGPLDAYFNHQFGRLGYRTVTFEKNIADGDYQGNAIINYCNEEVPYTRIHEHKHFTPWESHEKTVYVKEFSKETGPHDIPYYPKRLKADKELLALYRQAAEQTTAVSFLGRLATYRYMDMHHVIGEAMAFADKFLEAVQTGQQPPIFPNTEG